MVVEILEVCNLYLSALKQSAAETLAKSVDWIVAGLKL